MLETLIAATKTSAREAAQSTLEQQADGSTIANHKVIAEMCAANAVRSAQTLAPFVSRKLADTPEWIAFSTRRAQRLAPGTGNGAWQSGVVVGMARVPSAACSTALHACTRASIKMHPSSDCGIGILWSMAVQELSPSTPESRTVPGVLERHALLGQMRATATPTYKSLYGVTEQRTAAALERYISAEAQRPMPSAAAGVTRSFVSLRTVFEVHAHTLKSARRLKQEGKELFEKCVGDNVNCPGRETATSTAALVAGTRDVAGASSSKRLEPYCTPAPRLAVGLRLNELLRRFMQGRSRKLGPCRVLLGCHTNAEIGRDMPLVSDSEPLPMCTITDFNVRIDSGVLDGRYGEYASAEAQQQQQQCVEPVPGSVSLHVCLNGAVRLPELLAQLPGSDADAVWHKRALLYVGASQASYIGETGAMISAAAANANINSSKKINVRGTAPAPQLADPGPGTPSTFDDYDCDESSSSRPRRAVRRHQHDAAALGVRRVRRRHQQRGALLCGHAVQRRVRARFTNRRHFRGPRGALPPLRPARARHDDAVGGGGQRARRQAHALPPRARRCKKVRNVAGADARHPARLCAGRAQLPRRLRGCARHDAWRRARQRRHGQGLVQHAVLRCHTGTHTLTSNSVP